MSRREQFYSANLIIGSGKDTHLALLPEQLLGGLFAGFSPMRRKC